MRRGVNVTILLNGLALCFEFCGFLLHFVFSSLQLEPVCRLLNPPQLTEKQLLHCEMYSSLQRLLPKQQGYKRDLQRQ